MAGELNGPPGGPHPHHNDHPIHHHGGGGGTPTPTPTPDPPSAADNAALTMLTQLLTGWGLGDLADWAWKQYTSGALDLGNAAAMLPALLRTDPVASPIFYSRFPALKQLEADGKGISPDAYVQFENTVSSELDKNGFPGVYRSDEITKMLLGHMSAQEATDRIRTAAAIAYQTPPQVQEAFTRLYGTQGVGALASFLMDPDLTEPALTRAYGAAQVAGAAQAAGLGTLDKATAERLATLPDSGNAWSGAAAVAAQRTAFDSLFGGTQQADSTDALAASLGDAGSAEKVAAQRKARVADYSGGGTLAASQTGVSGLSSAAR